MKQPADPMQPSRCSRPPKRVMKRMGEDGMGCSAQTRARMSERPTLRDPQFRLTIDNSALALQSARDGGR
eukprot:2481952-Pleurochrysis_carterae.AAC.6